MIMVRKRTYSNYSQSIEDQADDEEENGAQNAGQTSQTVFSHGGQL